MTDDQKNADAHYDGIIEHDHPLPNWWVAIFFLTIIYGAIYYLHYESNSGPTSDQELQAGLEHIYALQTSVGSTDIDLASVIGDETAIREGTQIYADRCAMCHAPEGQGLIGPNLVDRFWIHGSGQPEEILQMVQKGVPEKGMPAWEAVMKPEEQAAVVAFVYSIKGTTPANPKGPEGTEAKE